jgi:hypothetical protein
MDDVLRAFLIKSTPWKRLEQIGRSERSVLTSKPGRAYYRAGNLNQGLDF